MHHKEAHVYLNSIQQMGCGEYLRVGSPDTVLPDTVEPLREHPDSVQFMVSGECYGGERPDTVCWTQLRNTWETLQNQTQRKPAMTVWRFTC